MREIFKKIENPALPRNICKLHRDGVFGSVEEGDILGKWTIINLSMLL